MAKTFQSGMATYERKTQAAIPTWKQRTLSAEPYLVEGIREAGGQPGPEFLGSWRSGVNAANYRGGNPNKWLQKTLAGIAR